MKNCFMFINGVITLSVMALLSFIGYALMEMRYYFENWIPGDGAAMVEMLVILLIVGVWLRALFTASNGRRSGLVVLIILGVFNIMIGMYDVQYVINTPMPWPEKTMVIAVTLAGVIAAIAALAFLGKDQKTTY